MSELFRFPYEVRGKSRTGYSLFDSYGLVHIPTEWFRHLLINSDYAQGTIDGYAKDLKQYADFLEGAGRFGLVGKLDDRFLLADRCFVDEWLANERDVKGNKRSTRKRRETAVKTFYQYLGSDSGGRRYVDHPYKRKGKLSTLSSARGTQSALNEAQVDALLLNLHNECERVLWQTGYDAGLRISELILLPKSAVDTAKQIYRMSRERRFEARYIPIDVPTKKKGGDEQITMPVFISTPTLERIIEYHHTDDYEFSPDWDMDDPLKPAFLTCTCRQWKYSNAYKQLYKAAQRTQLLISIHPHLFRHSSCVSILTSTDHGKTHLERFFAAWKNLRHVNPSTTERYAHLPWDSLMKLNEDDTVYCARHEFLIPKLEKIG